MRSIFYNKRISIISYLFRIIYGTCLTFFKVYKIYFLCFIISIINNLMQVFTITTTEYITEEYEAAILWKYCFFIHGYYTSFFVIFYCKT